MKRVSRDTLSQEAQGDGGWLAQGLGFQNRELERRFTAHRQRLMAPIVRLWALFGTAAVLATLARRGHTQWAITLGLLAQAARFLVLRHFAGVSGSITNALQIASFPLRAAFLVVSSTQLAAETHSVSHLLPLFAVYDAVLYPCIEQGRVSLWLILHLTTMFPAWTLLLWYKHSLATSVALSLGILAVAVTITFTLEAFNRRQFLEVAGDGDAGSRSSSRRSSSGPAVEIASEDDLPSKATVGFDTLSDSELMELREAMFAPPTMDEVRAAMRPMTTLHLRLAHGDPDQLVPGAKQRLMEEVAKMCPGLRVLGCIVRRGSLLVAVNVARSHGGEGAQHGTAEDQLGRIMPAQWLQWLGLPDGMELTSQVVNHPDQRASCFADVPLVMVLPTDASSVVIDCGSMQPGESVRASFLGANMPVKAVTNLTAGSTSEATGPDAASGGSSSSFSSSKHGEQPRQVVEVTMQQQPQQSGAESGTCTGLLMLEAWSTVSNTVTGSAPVLVLQPSQEAVAKELCTEISPSAIGLQGKSPASGTAALLDTCLPCVRQLVATLGWWIELAAGAVSGQGSAPSAGKPQAATQQLLLHVGTRLLRLLVHQGRPAAAHMVLEQLLNCSCGSVGFETLRSGTGHPLGRSLLHLAMLSGSGAMVDEALAWEGMYKCPWQWDIQDADGTTPLHIAALVNSGRIASKLLLTCTAARTAWDTAKGGRGLTPAQLAERVGRMTAAGGGPIRDHFGASAFTVGSRSPKAPMPKMVRLVEAHDSQPHLSSDGGNDHVIVSGGTIQQQQLKRRHDAPGTPAVSRSAVVQPPSVSEANRDHNSNTNDRGLPLPSSTAAGRPLAYAMLLGFRDSATEARFLAFKASVLAGVSSRWYLVKLCINLCLALRSVLSGSKVAAASLLLLSTPYIVQLLALRQGLMRTMEPLNVAVILTRYSVHALWASGGLLYPAGTEAAMMLDYILFIACEVAGSSNLEQVRFPAAMLMHAFGVVAHTSLFGFLGLHRPMEWSFVVHSVALAVRFTADFRHRCEFLKQEEHRALPASMARLKDE